MVIADTPWKDKVAKYPNGRGGYARLSKNREGLSESVNNQFSDVELTFEDNEWLYAADLMFSDDNISASEYANKKERPGYVALIEAIREGKLWLIVVTEVSRLTRDINVGVDFIALSREVGGVVVMTTEGQSFDLKTTTGVHDFLAAVLEASRESGIKSDRIKRNKRKVTAKGRYHGGRPRFGRARAIKDEFGRVINTGKVGHEIVEAEAEIINQTIDRICELWPIASITRDLEKRGVVGVGGKPFVRQTLISAISSKHVIGVQVSNGREYPGAFPPIVKDRAKWERAMAILRAQRDTLKRHGRESYAYLFKGECARCGGLMKGHARNGSPNYQCQMTDDVGRKVGCGMQRKARPVELLVTDAVLYRYNSPGFIEALRNAHQKNKEHDELGRLIDRAQQIQNQLNELEDAWTNGSDGLDLQTMLRMKSTLEKELNTVNGKMERSAAGQMVAAITKGGIQEAFDRADIGQQRVYINLIVEKVIFRPTKPNGKRNTWTHEGTGESYLFEPDAISIIFKF